MARVAVQLTNFTGGELSPRLDGRNDLAKYSSGCSTLENLVVYPHGSAARRPGTNFVAEVKDSTKKTRLIPFEFSTTQTYMLEFGDQYIRFYKDNGQILSGGSAYEISTPYLEAELFDLKFAQSADVMYICHPNHEVEKLSRTGHTSWSLTDVDFLDGPYLDTNISTTTISMSAHTVGTGRTLTASAVTGINSGSGFLTTDVGRLVRFRNGYGKITARTSTTVVTVEILEDMGSSSSSIDWSLGAFSDTTGHPSCVTFFEQRLVFAATLNNPQTVYFSKSGDYENMDANIGGTIADDDAIIYTIASNQVNAIRFMTATRTLIIGTAGGEFAVSGGGADNAITPTNILIKKQSNHGAANVDAIAVGNATLFLQRARRKIRELAFNFDVDGYVAPDMTILAEHITEGGLTQVAYQQEPNQIIYATREDGELVGLTYQREQQVTAWHRHIFGGRFGIATITVSDYANIANKTKLTLTKSDGTTVDFDSTTGTAGTNEFKTETNNNTTATNLKNAINAHANFTATVSSAVVTITETAHEATGYLTIKSFDKTRLTATSEGKAVVDSVAVIPTDDKEYQTWVIVKRTVNGATKRYVEYLNELDFDETDNTSFNFLDSALSYSGSAVTNLSGLSHLEGQVVSILADGATHPNKTVSSGAITLDRSAKDVKIGLAFTSLLQTMRLDAGSQDGTSQGKTKRIYDITVRMYETIGIEVGPDLDNMERIPFRSSANLMDEGIPPFTGDKEIEFRGNYETDGFIFVRQTQPLPFTILSLYPRLTTNDG
jgi:hypothetical protein